MRWKLIKSAPKDGTTILLASIGEASTFNTTTLETTYNPELKVHWVQTGMWSHRYDRFYDGFEPAGFANLTHWMPVPDASTAELATYSRVMKCDRSIGLPGLAYDACFAEIDFPDDHEIDQILRVYVTDEIGGENIHILIDGVNFVTDLVRNKLNLYDYPYIKLGFPIGEVYYLVADYTKKEKGDE